MAIINTITADNTELSAENLPQTVTLSISAEDTNDGDALFTHNWVMLDKPPNSTAVLSADTGTSVTFDADIWGTYRIFCISQNTETLETSNQDPLRAPLTDFINIEVVSENYDLHKPAKSQRNWHSRYWHLVDVVEGLRGGTPATFIAGGTSEIATAAEIAQSYGVADSSSGEHFLVVTTEQLNYALSPTANGQLTSGQTNNFRDNLKTIALEQINESSITELADVNTDDYTLSDGKILVWSSTATDDQGGTGAWIPQTLAEAQGDDGLFGVGLCSGETLDDGDFLIYESDCGTNPSVAIPGWHARNRNYPTFMAKLPFASPGKTSIWNTVAESAGLDWDDDTAHPGQVAIADKYEIARAFDYDALTYNGSSYASALSLGLLPSLAMTAGKFYSAVLSGSELSINYATEGTGSDGLRDVFYDALYHTTAEQATLQAAVDAGTYSTKRINTLQTGLSTFVRTRINRTSITHLSDVDTTTTTPSNGDVLVWDATATDDSGLNLTGAWVPSALASGDITAVIAGSGLTGGGTSGDVTLNVSNLDTSHLNPASLLTAGETFVDSDGHLMSAAAILDLIQANAGSGSSSVGDQYDIQLADGSGGFIASNWQVNSTNHLVPITTNAYDLGSSTKRVRKTYAYDGDFADDVRVSGDLTVNGQQIMQEYAFINDDGTAGTLLFTAGENGIYVGSIRNKTDNVIIESVASGGEASLEFKAGAGAVATQKILSNSGKLSNSNSIKLPAMAVAPSVGDFLRTTVVSGASGRDVEVEFQEISERVVYSTHVSREVTEEASFSGGNMVFSGNQQACMYWFQNNTGKTLSLEATHIHIGEMKNLTLSFSLCKATSASNAISNTWTQVGSSFTVTNSSGVDNVVGQAQASVFTTTSIAAGEYLGICCTDIPALNRDDRRIVITFECDKIL